MLSRFLLTLLLGIYIIGNAQTNTDGNRDWSIIASYTIPGKASGLAWDGTYIYFGIYGADGDHVYQFDPSTGNASLLFVNAALDDSYGMTWDGSALWTVDQPSSPSTPANAQEMDLNGTFGTAIALPDHYMSGIAYDDGDFWVGTYYPDPGVIYKIDNSGTVLDQFTPPADQTWDICLEGDDLWIADYNANMLYKTDQSGNILESHPCENIKPSGIVFDGTFLWYVDGQLSSNSTLYKVDLYGAGTPQISVPIDEHDYGTVTIGENETWNCTVQNTGSTDLIITNLVIPSAVPIFTSFTTPHTLTPGQTAQIPLTFQPSEFGELDTDITISSNDPINPNVDVHLSGWGVYNGPTFFSETDDYDYGLVRTGAYTRWFMEIQNRGDEVLEITAIDLPVAQYSLDESIVFPVQINTLDVYELGIWFHPDANNVFEGRVDIFSNDPDNNPYLLMIHGEGEKKDYPIGDPLWYYYITGNYDNSPKAIMDVDDITHDGIPDVIVCSEDNTIRCINGNSHDEADVMWAREIYSGNIYAQSAICQAPDIDGDGFTDFIVGTTGGDRSIHAISSKTGESIWTHSTTPYGEGGWVYDVDCSYDYNADDAPDVLACAGDNAGGTGPRRTYCLDLFTGDVIWESFAGGAVFSTLGVEDFTGDGQADAIMGATYNSSSEGKLHLIDGADGDIIYSYNTGGTSVWALQQLDDINGDDIKDIAFGDFSGNIYFMDPVNHTILETSAIYNALILRCEEVADVNNDGYRDILVAHSKTNATILDGYTANNVWSTALADKSWCVSNSGDINGDEIDDIMVGTLYEDNYAYFLDGSNGDELYSTNYGEAIDAIRAIPDIVGDLTSEMVVGGRTGKVYCYSGGLGLASGVQTDNFIPEMIRAYPNPFMDMLIIDIIQNDQAAFCQLSVYNLNGQKVAELFNGNLGSGIHQFYWNGYTESGQLASPGIYIIQLQNGNTNEQLKVIKSE